MTHGFQSPRATAAGANAPRIVLALSPRERGLFFGQHAATRIAGWQILDDADLAPSHWEDSLRRTQPTVLVTGWSTPPISASWLLQPGCPLQYVCHVTGSVRHLVPRQFLERGGTVTNWGETVSAQVAEHALLLALAALRNAGEWAASIATRDPRRTGPLATKTLFGRHVGLHGFGSVARALVPLLRPFGVTMAAHSAGVPAAFMEEWGVKPVAALGDLFASSEVLFECEALTPATEGSVSGAVLARLPDDAVFVNVGRGGVVDEDALTREARAGRLRLGLDVTRSEPLTHASPFFGLPNVVLSPHIGAPTLDRYRQCGEYALANLEAFLRGAIPPAAISLAAYDRAT